MTTKNGNGIDTGIKKSSLKRGCNKKFREGKGEDKQKNCIEQIELNEKSWLHGDKINEISEDGE